MGRPRNIKEYQNIDLKLGIKSSLPHIKSTLALYVLFWKVSGKPSCLKYSDELDNFIVCNEELLSSFINSYADFCDKTEEEIKNIVNDNQLFKSQCEALIVAFELVWKLGRISFVDNKPLSAERTGGNRFNKVIDYSSNMDILDAVLSNDAIELLATKILLSWMGLYEGVIDKNTEISILKILTGFAEGATFLLKNGNDDVLFNLEGVYEEVAKYQLCEITSDLEAKGPLRILKSIVSENMLFGLEAKGSTVAAIEDISNFAKRMDVSLSLTPKSTETNYKKDLIVDTSDKVERIQGAENRYLYGVPGAGKSHKIKTQFCDDEKYMERVVFHPDYTYSDFVGQILPKTESGTISYPFIPGPFTRVLKSAYDDPSAMYYLVIEEINRGNAPAIFGEIFQLLDRNSEVDEGALGESTYGINNSDIALAVYGDSNHLVKIPSNLSILATMNTADQNVFTLDTAFKRRWNAEMIPNNIDSCKHAKQRICGRNVKWAEFANKINEKILEFGDGNLSSEDNRLGAYFVKADELLDASVFAEKVLMYLWNDAFKFDRDKVFKSIYKSLEQLIEDFKDKAFDVFVEDFAFDNTCVENIVNDETHLPRTLYEPGDLSGTKPTKFVFRGEQISVVSYANMLRSVIEIVNRIDNDKMLVLAQNKFTFTNSGKVYISLDKTDLRGVAEKINGTNIYYDVQMDSLTVLRFIKALFDEFSVDYKDFSFEVL